MCCKKYVSSIDESNTGKQATRTDIFEVIDIPAKKLMSMHSKLYTAELYT